MWMITKSEVKKRKRRRGLTPMLGRLGTTISLMMKTTHALRKYGCASLSRMSMFVSKESMGSSLRL